MFRAEADQLIMLAKTNTIHVPEVYGVGCSQNHSFLLLEGLNMQPNNAQNMAEFGEQLARLHQYQGSDNYGLSFDTWLGPQYQPNDWCNHWGKFFSEQRIGWQLQLCSEKQLQFGDTEKIIKAVATLLAKHQPKPSLLHGNLWIENCANIDGHTVTYDPACYWGDRECDLAFTELFEPFPKEFYENYDRTFPLEEGYQDRKIVYQLYHLLNFSSRFHGNYVALANKLVNNVLQRYENL